jgi:PEGA domain
MSSGSKKAHPVTEADDPWGFGKSDGSLVEVRAGITADTFEHQPPATPRRLAAWMAVPAALVVVGLATYSAGRLSSPSIDRANAAMGTLVLSSHPSGAQVVVDGQPAGTTPLALQLAAGPHAVVISGAAGVSEQFSTEVAAGSSASRHVSLVPPVPVATSGALAIDASPGGGEVFVDGARAGTAPLTVSDLAPGPHVVQLRSPAGTIERRMSVVAGAVTSLVFGAPAAVGATGWISFTLPFEVQVYEGGTYVGSNRGERILVGAGRHRVDLVNESLGFRSTHAVVVGPGQTARLAVESPLGTLSVNAQPWAEVLIGGRSYGETPLANISLPLGVHEVTLRHPSLGERLQPVTIRLGAPNRVSLDLRR